MDIVLLATSKFLGPIDLALANHAAAYRKCPLLYYQFYVLSGFYIIFKSKNLNSKKV